jgi:hypothetical protein
MPDDQHCGELGEDATIDIFAALMIDRFGAHAAVVAIDQLTAAHATGGGPADRWLSIVMSIEDRLRLGETSYSRLSGDQSLKRPDNEDRHPPVAS